MALIIIAVVAVLLFLVVLFFAGSWGLSSVTKDLQSYGRKILGKKAKKDARSILQLGYIIDRKWYEKTRENLNNLGDWESQELWQQLEHLEKAGESEAIKQN